MVSGHNIMILVEISPLLPGNGDISVCGRPGGLLVDRQVGSAELPQGILWLRTPHNWSKARPNIIQGCLGMSPVAKSLGNTREHPLPPGGGEHKFPDRDLVLTLSLVIAQESCLDLCHQPRQKVDHKSLLVL